MATMGEALVFTSRVDAAERRLEELAHAGMPAGSTDPDPGEEERWDAGQVWAHIAEFPTYWADQVRTIIAADARLGPVPFGRLKTDPSRTGPIERDRARDLGDLWQRADQGIQGVKVMALGLGAADWDREGLHPTRGVVTVGFILESFVARHLEEHAAQLEKLAAGEGTAG